eukprot:13693218-Alexandrium_andersonii.AAC.1
MGALPPAGVQGRRADDGTKPSVFRLPGDPSPAQSINQSIHQEGDARGHVYVVAGEYVGGVHVAGPNFGERR